MLDCWDGRSRVVALLGWDKQRDAKYGNVLGWDKQEDARCDTDGMASAEKVRCRNVGRG